MPKIKKKLLYYVSAYLPDGTDIGDSYSAIKDQLDLVNEETPGTNIRLRHKHISLDPGNITEATYNAEGVEGNTPIRVVSDLSEESEKKPTRAHARKLSDSFEPYTLESFAHATVSHSSDSVMQVLHTLAHQLVPHREGFRFHLKDGFLSYLSTTLQVSCSLVFSIISRISPEFFWESQQSIFSQQRSSHTQDCRST